MVKHPRTCFLSTVSAHMHATGASVFPAQGSPVGDSFQLMCPAGSYVTAFTGAAGDALEEVSVMCSDGSKLTAAGSKASGKPFAFGSTGGFAGVTAVANDKGVNALAFHSYDKKGDKYIDSPMYGKKGSKESKMSCRDNEKIIGIHGKTWKNGYPMDGYGYDGSSSKHDRHEARHEARHERHSSGTAPCSGPSCSAYITSFGVICGKPPCSKKGCSFAQPCSGKSRKGKGGCYFNPCSGCPYKYPCAPGCMDYMAPAPPKAPAPPPSHKDTPAPAPPKDTHKKAPLSSPKPPAPKPAAPKPPPPTPPPEQRGRLAAH